MVELDELERLLNACINGGRGWKYGPLHPEGGFKSIEDVATFLAEEAMKSDGPKALELWCVHVPHGDDASLIVCVAGNGPTSEAHARFLAATPYAVNGMAAELRTLRATIKDAWETLGGERKGCDAALGEALSALRRENEWLRARVSNLEALNAKHIASFREKIEAANNRIKHLSEEFLQGAYREEALRFELIEAQDDLVKNEHLRARVAELERAARESDDALAEYHRATSERVAELERDARLGAVVREAADTCLRLDFTTNEAARHIGHAAISALRADALRAEEGGE